MRPKINLESTRQGLCASARLSISSTERVISSKSLTLYSSPAAWWRFFIVLAFHIYPFVCALRALSCSKKRGRNFSLSLRASFNFGKARLAILLLRFMNDVYTRLDLRIRAPFENSQIHIRNLKCVHSALHVFQLSSSYNLAHLETGGIVINSKLNWNQLRDI